MYTHSFPFKAKYKHLYSSMTYLVKLGLGEVHLRMCVHELLQHVLLVLLLRCGQTSSFLALVVHHLLHGLSGVAVQVRQLAVLGLHLINLVCVKSLKMWKRKLKRGPFKEPLPARELINKYANEHNMHQNTVPSVC